MKLVIATVLIAFTLAVAQASFVTECLKDCDDIPAGHRAMCRKDCIQSGDETLEYDGETLSRMEKCHDDFQKCENGKRSLGELQPCFTMFYHCKLDKCLKTCKWEQKVCRAKDGTLAGFAKCNKLYKPCLIKNDC